MSLPAKYIDIREVIRKKNPRLLAALPGFVLAYIRRILHEDDINNFMIAHGHSEGLDFVHAVLNHFGVHTELQGIENMRAEGGVIYAANHPLGGLDGLAMMHELGKHGQDLKFLVNDIVANIKQLAPLFIPVNKHGSQGRDALQVLNHTLQTEQAFIVFPAGLVSRKQPHGIQDLEWKKTFISQARRFQKDVVPVYIHGRNSHFFYNLARLRKWLGIKANIEMFYLVDEMFAQKNKKISIQLGTPIPWQTFDKQKTDKEWAAYVREKVYALKS
ncbi:MAG: 1-acyl-sn-glycerol-3-phosphate acyltransferase [Bacteroidia bacterium]